MRNWIAAAAILAATTAPAFAHLVLKRGLGPGGPGGLGGPPGGSGGPPDSAGRRRAERCRLPLARVWAMS